MTHSIHNPSPCHPPRPCAHGKHPLKKLLLLPAAALVIACASCSESGPAPPPPPVTDTEPVGEGLKVIGYALLGAAVVVVLGRMLR